jgi:hypothetical protein
VLNWTGFDDSRNAQPTFEERSVVQVFSPLRVPMLRYLVGVSLIVGMGLMIGCENSKGSAQMKNAVGTPPAKGPVGSESGGVKAPEGK